MIATSSNQPRPCEISAGHGSCHCPVSRRVDVVDWGGKAAGAALGRPDCGEYTQPLLPCKITADRHFRTAPYAGSMKRLAIVIGLLAALAGLVWLLQGIGLPPGSFMSGDPTWAVIGAVTLVAGAGAMLWARRSR